MGGDPRALETVKRRGARRFTRGGRRRALSARDGPRATFAVGVKLGRRARVGGHAASRGGSGRRREATAAEREWGDRGLLTIRGAEIGARAETAAAIGARPLKANERPGSAMNLRAPRPTFRSRASAWSTGVKSR